MLEGTQTSFEKHIRNSRDEWKRPTAQIMSARRDYRTVEQTFSRPERTLVPDLFTLYADTLKYRKKEMAAKRIGSCNHGFRYEITVSPQNDRYSVVINDTEQCKCVYKWKVVVWEIGILFLTVGTPTSLPLQIHRVSSVVLYLEFGSKIQFVSLTEKWLKYFRKMHIDKLRYHLVCITEHVDVFK